jgi:malate synthase
MVLGSWKTERHRISSQLLANWLAQDIITESELDASLVRPGQAGRYARTTPSTNALGSPGRAGPRLSQAARLIIDGGSSPSGYTEPILHRIRGAVKGSAGHARRPAGTVTG